MAKVEMGHTATHKTENGRLLTKAARAIGSAVGIAAAKTGLAHTAATHGPRVIDGKFQKTHKHRLPRKLKKSRGKGISEVHESGM